MNWNRFNFDFKRIIENKEPETGVKAMRTTIPTKRLLDPDFKYVSSCSTDLAETFRKAREQRQSEPNTRHATQL